MPTLHHESSLNIFNQNRIMKEIADYCCSVKVENKGSVSPRRQQMVYKYH